MANRFQISLAKGDMEATLSVAAGEPCTAADLRKAIGDAGVSRGVLEDVVEKFGQQAADNNFTTNKQVIAKGKPPSEGKSGKLHIDNANAKKDIPASHLADGKAKASGKGSGDNNYLISVVKGQEIGHVDLCQNGEPGFTVKGTPLKCKKVEDPLDRLGKGLSCNVKNMVCVLATGVLFDREGEKLVVVPVPANKRILLTIGDDKMTAVARLFPGDVGNAQTVTDTLEEAGITHGVVEAATSELAQKLVDEASQIDELLVAEGVASETGEDGYFEPDFSVGTLAGKVRKDGSIDYRDRSMLIAVAEREVIGLYYSPTDGKTGYDVMGADTAPSPGKEVPVKLGDGAEMGDNNTVVASIAGVINYQPGGVLQVNDAYEHRGDVDLKSGDLKMNGAIIVTGDVTRDAKVQATEGVVVKGVIDAGGVECDGSVTVEGGVMVEGKAWIRAGGDVTCRHTQGARIESKGTITIQQNAINSFFKAKSIAGESDASLIRGGALCAEEQIVVGEAGPELGARTVLSVAMPLNWEYPTVAEKLGGGAGAAKPGPGKKGRAKTGKREKTESSAAQLSRLLEIARIEVRGKIHPGVVIEIGKLSKTIEQSTTSVRFRYAKIDGEPMIEMIRISRGAGDEAKAGSAKRK